jgi:hypothetical protein
LNQFKTLPSSSRAKDPKNVADLTGGRMVKNTAFIDESDFFLKLKCNDTKFMLSAQIKLTKTLAELEKFMKEESIQ